MFTTLRQRTLAALLLGGIVAIYGGVQLASENWLPVAFLGIALALFLTARLWISSIEVFLLAGALLGYILGNRGFAQIMPIGLPLFYAEFALGTGGIVLLIRAALERRLPLRTDWLNLSILLWMLVCGARLLLDVRGHGFVALRDFAMVYYAGFFFLAQQAMRTDFGRTILLRSLTWSTLLVVPLFLIEDTWSTFFLQYLVVFGVPVVLHKPDLVSVYAGIGVVWAYFQQRHRPAPIWIGMFLINLAGIAHISTRALFVALASVVAAAFGLGHRALLRWMGLSGAAGLLLLTSLAFLSPQSFSDSKLYSLYEHVRSMADVGGDLRYANEDASSSGDNNRFRFIWWRMLAQRTMQENPVFGLGFGADIADDFIRAYNPLEADTFTARSPHNILLTIFARSGLLGLVCFGAIMATMARATWLSRSSADSRQTGLWLCAWVVLICACFGVVLEGPMGAVVFWILAGAAHGFFGAKEENPAADHSTVPAGSTAAGLT